MFSPSDKAVIIAAIEASASAELTLCSVRPPAVGVTGAGVAFTADIGVVEMGAVGSGGTGGGVVGIVASAAAVRGLGAGASAGVGCDGGAAGDGGGFSAAAASPNIQPRTTSITY